MYQDFLRYEGFDVMDAKNSNSKYKKQQFTFTEVILKWLQPFFCNWNK